MTDQAETYVLVVDDLPEQREIYREILQHAGIRVLEAEDGATALALARAHVPDVVLLDVRLPDISGLEVLRTLGGDARTGRIPVLLLTATTLGDESGGFAELLTKPVYPRARHSRRYVGTCLGAPCSGVLGPQRQSFPAVTRGAPYARSSRLRRTRCAGAVCSPLLQRTEC